jgi:hypothetical protein
MYIWVCKSVKLLRAEAGSDAERTCLARLASNQMPCVNSEYVHVIDQGSSHDAMGSTSDETSVLALYSAFVDSKLTRR